MTTATKTVKKIRTLRVTRQFADGWLLLLIDCGKDRDHYAVNTLPSDWGRAFRFKNMGDGVTYNTLLSADGHSTCECAGFLRWGTECKHIGAARKLVEDGAFETRRIRVPVGCEADGVCDVNR